MPSSWSVWPSSIAREEQRDCCARAPSTCDVDGAAVQVHDRLHDGQPQAGSVRGIVGRIGARGIGAVEAVEEARQVLGADAGTSIRDGELGSGVIGFK